jgi:hypothetical protein
MASELQPGLSGFEQLQVLLLSGRQPPIHVRALRVIAKAPT